MVYHIYIHQNILNLKIYVGVSDSYKRRWRDQKRTARNEKDKQYNNLLYKAIRKYGWDGFTHQVIEEWDNKEDALEAEKFWIEFFRSNIKKYGREYGYNMHEGGNMPPSNKGQKRPHSGETKRKQSIAAKNREKKPRTERQKQQLAATQVAKKGKKLPKETSDKMKRTNSLKRFRRWSHEWLTRKPPSPKAPRPPMTEEWKQKISLANKGKIGSCSGRTYKIIDGKHVYDPKK